jgi:hypothetical protein
MNDLQILCAQWQDSPASPRDGGRPVRDLVAVDDIGPANEIGSNALVVKLSDAWDVSLVSLL